MRPAASQTVPRREKPRKLESKLEPVGEEDRFLRRLPHDRAPTQEAERRPPLHHSPPARGEKLESKLEPDDAEDEDRPAAAHSFSSAASKTVALAAPRRERPPRGEKLEAKPEPEEDEDRFLPQDRARRKQNARPPQAGMQLPTTRRMSADVVATARKGQRVTARRESTTRSFEYQLWMKALSSRGEHSPAQRAAASGDRELAAPPSPCAPSSPVLAALQWILAGWWVPRVDRWARRVCGLLVCLFVPAARPDGDSDCGEVERQLVAARRAVDSCMMQVLVADECVRNLQHAHREERERVKAMRMSRESCAAAGCAYNHSYISTI